MRDADSLYPVSVQEWLDQENASEGIRKLFKGLCIALMASTSLERLSLGELVQYLREAVRKLRGFGYPIGGWRSILDPMVNVVNRRGKIKTDCEVDEVLVENGSAIGVRSEEEEVKSDFVVCALPAQRLPSLVGQEILPENYCQMLEELKETAGVSIDFGLDESVSTMRSVIITLDPPTLGWFTSNLDPSLAPPDKQMLTTFSPIDADRLEEESDDCLRELEELYMDIFPKMADRIIWKRQLSTVVNGAELNVDQTRVKRPSIETPVEDLFLVGDTTNASGVGGEIAFNSARICFNILRESRPI